MSCGDCSGPLIDDGDGNASACDEAFEVRAFDASAGTCAAHLRQIDAVFFRTTTRCRRGHDASALRKFGC